METPRSKNTFLKSIRKHTPFLLERKKKLFHIEGRPNLYAEPVQHSCALDGIVPITSEIVLREEIDNQKLESHRTLEILLSEISISKTFSFLHDSMDSSDFLSEKENPPLDTQKGFNDDDLQLLFMNSMNLSNLKKVIDSKPVTDLGSKKSMEKIHLVHSFNKRFRENTTPSANCHKFKKIKLEHDLGKSSTIPTGSFYSNSVKTSPRSKEISKTEQKKVFTNFKIKLKKRRNIGFINKGVHHNIKPKFKMSSKLHRNTTNREDILNLIRNEKLLCLFKSKRVGKHQVERIYNIIKSAQTPIEVKTSSSVIAGIGKFDYLVTNSDSINRDEHRNEETDLGFSDIESDDEYINRKLSVDGTNDTSFSEQNTVKKKIFKSGCSTKTKKEFQVTNKIKASLYKGKIHIFPLKKANNRRNTEFSKEQAMVDEILKNFEKSLDAETKALEAINIEGEHSIRVTDSSKTLTAANNEAGTFYEHSLKNFLRNPCYSKFYRRIPVNTTDPQIIEQQYLLLDFLISNNICTEKNFNIFIANPEEHKEEASRIVDQIIADVNRNMIFRQRIPFNTNDPVLMQQQEKFLEFLIENKICTEENFNIFITDYEKRRKEAEDIVSKTFAKAHNASGRKIENIEKYINKHQVKSILTKNVEETKLFPIFYRGKCRPIVVHSTRKKNIWNAGLGLDQYQIDAGQKEFGMRQCHHCGLVYTVHEAEEEKLHEDYHKSMHILRFKGWIDEDIVALYPEWGSEGRILRMSENAHVKRKERLMDILQIVDRELGFSSSKLPHTFVAYIAVRKNEIVGLCVVEPLDKASKYVSVNGIDCYTEETYESKCGISRIWVSPSNRRSQIASKLIKAVQTNTVYGKEIPMDKIAFSAPTIDGKKFAQKITQVDNFLVYQSVESTAK